LNFSDGTRVRRGAPVLRLHIWNEQMPVMPPQGATLAWARQLGHAIDASLVELAHYMDRHSDLNDISAICADMRLRSEKHSQQLKRLSGLYGFEEAGTGGLHATSLHDLGENILGLLLVVAANPAAARLAVLRRTSTVVYLSRATLYNRYLKRAESPTPRAVGTSYAVH
jgi:YkoP domain